MASRIVSSIGRLSAKGVALAALLGASAAFGDAVSFANPSDWTVCNHRDRVTVTLGAEVDGRKSLLVVGATNVVDTAWRVRSRKFALNGGARGFRLSFDTVLDIDLPGTLPGSEWGNVVLWYDRDGRSLGSCALAFSVGKGTGDAFAMGPIPAGATFAAVQFGLDQPNLVNRARLVFRNLFFETFDWPLKESGSVMAGTDRRAPCVAVASATPTTDPHTVLKVRVWDESGVDWTALRLSVDGRDRTDGFRREGEVLTLTNQVETWTGGPHEIDYVVRDTKGNAQTNKTLFLIGETPKTPRVTVRADGMTLVDGEPFFPIGIFSVCRREFNGMNLDKAFRDLRKAGFNFAHTYHNAYDPEFFPAAEKNGFRLFVASRIPSKDLIEKGRHQRSVIAWYTGDDTSATQTPESLRATRDALRAVDPTRLTCQADVSGLGTTLDVPYLRYVDGTDVIMPEIYPVRGKAGDESDAICVAQTISSMRAYYRAIASAKDGPKSCWPILQYFQGWSVWRHFPSREQLYATAFAAIIHGAKGLTWYTYGGFYNPKRDYYDEGITSRPERFETIAGLCNWLRELTPALVAEGGENPPVAVLDGPKKDPYGNDSVTALLKRVGGKTYLFSVNSSSARVRARFAADGAATVDVLRENRRLACGCGTANGTAFEDDFAPFAVHVYRW